MGGGAHISGGASASCSNTTKRYYRIDRRQIHYLKFILEAYDGIAVMTTVDTRQGLVVLHIAPGCEPDVDRLLGFLQQEIMVEAAGDPCQEAL